MLQTLPNTTSFMDLPNELILQIASDLETRELNSLLQTSPFLVLLLSPVLFERAVAADAVVVARRKRTVFHWAASHNRPSLMKALLQRGARINAADNDRMTPLHSAVITEGLAAVALLLEYGADTEVCNQYRLTPLHLAVILGNRTLVEMLLQKGADIESRGNGGGRMNALHYGAAFGNIDVVQALLSWGCDNRAVDLWGLNAIQIAVISSQTQMCRWLLGVGGFNTHRKANDASYRSSAAYYIRMVRSTLSFHLERENDLCNACRAK